MCFTAFLISKSNMRIFLFSISIIFNSLLYSQSDSIRLCYNFINSNPQNAEVYMNGTYIGSTPLYFVWGDSVFPKTIKLNLKGFFDLSETFFSKEIINRDYILYPLIPGYKVSLVKENKSDFFSSPRKIFPIVSSSVAALSSGFFAYYFKQLSIKNKEEYEESGDLEILERKRRYDIISGISMGVFQVSFCILLYFLFQE